MSIGGPAISLVLLMTANGLPWVVGRMCRGRWGAPLDFGLTLGDGNRLFGSHKTWRGLVTASAACAAVGKVFQLAWSTGALFGALSMVGDTLSSALKRRLRYEPGREVLLLDQLPEALLPLIALREPLGLDPVRIAIVAVVFLALDVASARVRHWPTARGARRSGRPTSE